MAKDNHEGSPYGRETNPTLPQYYDPLSLQKTPSKDGEAYGGGHWALGWHYTLQYSG